MQNILLVKHQRLVKSVHIVSIKFCKSTDFGVSLHHTFGNSSHTIALRCVKPLHFGVSHYSTLMHKYGQLHFGVSHHRVWHRPSHYGVGITLWSPISLWSPTYVFLVCPEIQVKVQCNTQEL